MALSGSFSKTIRTDGAYTLRVDWTATQSVANNTSIIKAKVYFTNLYALYISARSATLNINGVDYTFSNAAINTTGEHLLATITSGPIAHNSDGSKTVSISCTWPLNATISGVTYWNVVASDSVVLDSIPRKSTLSVADGTLETAQTLTITEADSSFTHRLVYSCGDSSGYILGSSSSQSTSNSVSWTPPLSLAANNTTGTSVSIRFRLYTYTSGGTLIGDNLYTKIFTIPASVKPSVSFTVADSTGYLSTYGGYVQSKSKFQIAVTASGSQGSTISAYKTTADGKTYTDAKVTTAVIANSGTLSISVTVTDSRGRTATANKSVTVLAYAAPKITALSAYRSDSSGNSSSSGAYLTVKFSTAITSLGSKNTATYAVKYKKASAPTYTTVTASSYTGNYAVTNGVYVFAAETASSYDIQLVATDAFGSVPRTVAGPSVKKLISIGKSLFGLAFGKACELANTLDIALNVLLRNNLTMKNDVSIQSENASGANRTLMTLDASNDLAIGYSGYSNSEGRSVLYGNDVVIRTQNNVNINKNLLVGGTNITTALNNRVQKVSFQFGTLAEFVNSINTYGVWMGKLKDTGGWGPTGSGWFHGFAMLQNTPGSDVGGTVFLRQYGQTNCSSYVGYISGSSDSTYSVIWQKVATLLNTTAWKNTENQRLYIAASGEESYRAYLGVIDSVWAFCPATTQHLTLGTGAHKWGQIYSSNSAISTSDRTMKKNIEGLTDNHIEFFKRLQPVSFQFIDGKSGRTHIGFVAQDVEEAMKECGLTDLDFAGFCKDQIYIQIPSEEDPDSFTEEPVEGEYIYSLRYEEFIALNTHMIQYLDNKLKTLESDVEALKAAVFRKEG